MLSPEQEKQVEEIREQRASADILSHQTYASQLKTLLAIVDDLRKQLATLKGAGLIKGGNVWQLIRNLRKGSD